MRLDEYRLFRGRSLGERATSTSTSTSTGSISESTIQKSLLVRLPQDQAVKKVDHNIEKKIVVGLLVCAGLVIWTAVLILKDPSQALKDILSVFKSPK